MFQLARCADADAPEYFRRLAILFERREQILATGTMAGVRDALVALGGEWGLSETQVMAALTDEEGVERLRRSAAEADRTGISATPSFLINGELLTDPDFRTAEGMARILDWRLSRR